MKTVRYGVLYVPEFALQAAVGVHPAPLAGGAVLLEAYGKRFLVTQRNRAAAQAHIESGMTLEQARGRQETVGIFKRNSGAEKAATEALLAAGRTLSPRVESTDAGVCSFDLKGAPARSAETLASALRGWLEGAGLFAQVGLGPTPDLALLAARAARKEPCFQVVSQREVFLRDLPVAVGEPSEPLARIFEAWGLRTLGELAALPRAEVALRLGQEATALWDRMSPENHRPLHLTPPAPDFSDRIELESGVETLDPLLFLIRRMLDRLTLRLRGACRYAGAVDLALTESDGEGHQRRFQLPEPTQQTELLFRVLHLHLEQVRTVSPIVGVRLTLSPVDPPHRQRGLFDTALKDPWQLTDTCAKLQGLVGEGRVGAPELQDTYCPDAFVLGVLPETLPMVAEDKDAEHPYGPALRRHRPPLPVDVRFRAERPSWIRIEGEGVGIRHALGPYRLSGDWWCGPDAWILDEWDAQLTDGRLCRLARTPNGWLLVGFYD